MWCSVVQHLPIKNWMGAETEEGHYIAYVRCVSGFRMCNDEKVDESRPDEVFGAEAYMLFYERDPPRQSMFGLPHDFRCVSRA